MERARAAERQAAEASHATANETLQKVNARLTKLRAEEAGVAAALKSAADSLWPPLLDALTVDPGFEKALGAAFGEELEASSDRGAPIHWLPLGPLADAPALPDGATPLGAHVKAMPELERRLAFIGIVADEATGAALQAGLKPGQQLVTRDGAVWRWDGYTMRAGAPSTAAVRLSQRNRLAEIRQQIDGVAAEHAEAQARVEAETGWLAAARDAEKTCVEQARAHERSVAEAARRKTEDAGEATRAAERAAQQSIAVAERAATEARDRHVEIARRTDQLRTRLAGIEQSVAEIVGDIADAEMRRTFREARLSSISDTPGRPRGRRRACAGASPSCARPWSRPRATAIAWRARRRCGSSGWARSPRTMAAGASAWPRPRARSSSSTQRREQIAAVDRRACRQAGRDRGQARGAGRRDRQGRAEPPGGGRPAGHRRDAAGRGRQGDAPGRGRAGRRRARAACAARAWSSRRPRIARPWSSASSSACAASPTACWRWPRCSRWRSCPSSRRPSIGWSAWCTSARPWARSTCAPRKRRASSSSRSPA